MSDNVNPDAGSKADINTDVSTDVSTDVNTGTNTDSTTKADAKAAKKAEKADLKAEKRARRNTGKPLGADDASGTDLAETESPDGDGDAGTSVDADGTTDDPNAKSAPEDRDMAGPLDESEANPVRPYVDLGGVKILPREGLHLRLEIEEGSKRVVAIGLDYAGSTLQVQPFAAPRSSGLWHEIRTQIADQIAKQGGSTTPREGPFGPELVAEIPVAAGQGPSGTTRLARFIGVDGPRWFLRGVIAGEGAIDPAAAAQIEDLFRSIVVVRGASPMPPRDLIPLRMPATPAGNPEPTGV